MQNVIPNPVGYSRSGVYGVNARSGVMAAGLAAPSEIYQFRTNVAGYDIVVREVRLWANVDTVGFTAGPFIFRLSPARSFTSNGTGGTTITLTGNNGKLRTSYPTTQLSVAGSGIRVASTAALGAGTKSNDLNGINELAGAAPTVASSTMVAPTLFYDASRNVPLTLAQNEGFVILADVPATGTWTFGVSVLWEETRAFPR